MLDALARHDTDALRRLALSEEEFRDQVWPGLPASRPERNVPVEYVWGDLRQKSDAHLRWLVTERGGRRFVLVQLRFDGETTRYATGTVWRRPTFIVREPGGRTRELQFSGSMIERDGVWKVFSYVLDG